MWSIVVAGGSGRRFGDQKQFSMLGGRPVLEWAVEACRPCSAGVVLVLPAGLDDPDPHGADATVPGGPTRADSVRCGLAAVPDSAEVIVVHDAARPLASPGLFDAVIEAVTGGGADGAVPGVPPSDTIKAVDGAGNVTGTLNRSTLVAVQTPQAFRAGVLRRAHEQAGPGATDDAMLVEALGGRVRVVPGDPRNLKITAPDDLGAVARLLASREG
ncbi:MAG: 2-C-methyl-D-erythritol 4-phosphate cytidylyltransferase [Acidimicrobiales bacterium]